MLSLSTKDQYYSERFICANPNFTNLKHIEIGPWLIFCELKQPYTYSVSIIFRQTVANTAKHDHAPMPFDSFDRTFATHSSVMALDLYFVSMLSI